MNYRMLKEKDLRPSGYEFKLKNKPSDNWRVGPDCTIGQTIRPMVKIERTLNHTYEIRAIRSRKRMDKIPALLDDMKNTLARIDEILK